MRKGRDGENGKKIMTFIVASIVFANQPPERRPTGTPHARANLGHMTISLFPVLCACRWNYKQTGSL